MAGLESTEYSELSPDDDAEFEAFLASQQRRGIEIVGAERDNLRNVVFCSGADDREVTPTNIRLSTADC